jgi:hypothetical protein
VSSVPAPPYGRAARKLAKGDRREAEIARRQIRLERSRAAELISPSAAGSSASGRKAAKGADRTKRAGA